jgi:hypothetical protein
VKALLLLLFVSLAQAAPATPEQRDLIAHMVRECRDAMANGCRVEGMGNRVPIGTRDERIAAFKLLYPNGILVAGVGRFQAEDYFVFIDAGKKMCEVVAEECSKDYDGRNCKMARALWRQK